MHGTIMDVHGVFFAEKIIEYAEAGISKNY
jgi:hypothetical protein